MSSEMLRAVSTLLSTCSRRVSRAARKVWVLTWRQRIRRRVGTVFLGRKKIAGEESHEEEIWRRGIIMGEKCQPLDFSGAIYYDVDGRQLAEVPTPRSPMRSPLPSYLANDKGWI